MLFTKYSFGVLVASALMTFVAARPPPQLGLPLVGGIVGDVIGTVEDTPVEAILPLVPALPALPAPPAPPVGGPAAPA
ncbi:hypothetical protein C8F04DRAFT_389291 [Mycena alexandri]|uniref:Uncharacterized protein n=1 Tax=Mycena alexandri TaxID=1745969 RepID=A0AAD6T3A9_9AGAR|nr:hypothetical protein C8F04DRAFT_389291 [Mycena alexandri]